MYYILAFAAALLWALQFLFNQKFEEENGTGFAESLSFTAYSSGIMALILIAIKGFKPDFSYPSLLIASCYAVINIFCIYISMKAFSVVNLSKYSIYMMLGGMIIPSLFGIFYCNEPVTTAKLVCILLIIISILFTGEKGKSSLKEKIFFSVIFCLNGMFGILSTIHQSTIPENIRADEMSFMALNGIVSFFICFIIHIIKEKQIPKIKLQSIKCPIGFAVCTGAAETLTLIALLHLDTSVQYPIITGGTIAFSTLISIIRHEKVDKKNIIAVVIAFIASVCMVYN